MFASCYRVKTITIIQPTGLFFLMNNTIQKSMKPNFLYSAKNLNVNCGCDIFTIFTQANQKRAFI